MTAEFPRDDEANDQPPATQTLDDALAANGDAEAVVDVDEPTQQLVLFRLNGQPFALPGSAVSEILSSDQPVYYVPGLPASTEVCCTCEAKSSPSLACIDYSVYLHRKATVKG